VPQINAFRLKITLQQFNVFALVLGFLAYMVAFVLHFYNNPQESDVGCFMAIGKALNGDAILYKTVFDNKAPGIFFLHQLFQNLTNSSTHYPLILQGFFAGIFALSSALVLLKINPKLSFAPMLALFLTSLYYLQSRWGIFYYGGLTEEIGIYLILTAMNLVFLSQPNSSVSNKFMAFFAGLFSCYALGIKEPFALMFLGLLVYVWIGKNKQLRWAFMAGCAFVLLFWGGYLLLNGALGHYINYLKQAIFYAQSPSEPLILRIASRLEPVSFEFGEWLGHSGWNWLNITIILFVCILLFSRKSIHTLIKKESQFLIFQFLLLLGSIPFYWFGPKNHTHYFIPMLICILVFGSFVLAHFLSMIRSEFRAVHLILSVFILQETAFLYREIDRYTPPANDETTKLNNQFKLNQGVCFVDDYSAGRFYLYLDVTSNLKYPCAYPVFFEFNTPNSLAEERCKEFVSEFQKHPPKYILGKEKLSMAFDYGELKNWVYKRYRVMDSVKLNGMGYCLRELNPRD
jgi:hypothetical protein